MYGGEYIEMYTYAIVSENNFWSRKMKNLYQIILLVLFTNYAYLEAKENIFIEYNFSEITQDGLEISMQDGTKGALKEIEDMLEEIGDSSGNYALRLTRKGSLRFVHIYRDTPVPENSDYVITMRFRPEENGDFGISFISEEKEPIGTLYVQKNRLLAFNQEGKYIFSGIKFSKTEWYTLKIYFNILDETFKIKMTGEDGKVYESTVLQVLSKKRLLGVRFSNTPPEGSSVLIDDLKIIYNPDVPVENRSDACEGALITVPQSDGSSKSFPLLNNKDLTQVASVYEVPVELYVELIKTTRVSTIRLYDGDPRTEKFPSGACRLLKYTIQGQNPAGRWITLGNQKNAVISQKDLLPEFMYHQIDFPPVDITMIKILISDSSDTLKRVSGKKAVKKVINLREIGLWGDTLLSPEDRKFNFLKDIIGEFRLPVYQQQKIAEFHLHNLREDKKPWKVGVEVRDRYSDKLMHAVPLIELVYGENIIKIKLDGLPDGEYAAVVIDRNSISSSQSSFRRLLRLQRLKEVTPGQRIEKMTGKKMFFPDAFYLDTLTNIEFKAAQAKIEQAIKPDSVSDNFIRHGYQIFFDKDGTMYLPFWTVDRYWRKESKKEYVATRRLESDKKWGSWVIDKMTPDYITNKTSSKSPLNALPTSETTQDFENKPKNNEDIVFRFYDQKKDGAVNLKQVYFEYTRRYSGALGDQQKLIDWKIVNPPAASTWPIWYKSPKEALLLTKAPLLIDSISSGEFEEKTDCNDNMVGQWLTSDGKTLIYARGMLLKRYPPFIAPYDNLPNVSRIINVISTVDGINWKYTHMVPPDETDPPVAQHYGAQVYQVPEGNGLMQAFVYRYDAKRQRYDVEIAFSWDSINWHRYSGQPAFIENGEPRSWNAGHMNLGKDAAVAYNGVVYLLNTWASRAYHFMGHFQYNRSDINTITGEKIKTYFENKNLESWPYFMKFGSYNAIAAEIREAGVSVGIASYREDGLFYLEGSSEREGMFISRVLMSSQGMSANVVIGKDGFLTITLVDENKKLIPGYEKKIGITDSVQFHVFDKLPEIPFRISTKFKNIKLYSLIF